MNRFSLLRSIIIVLATFLTCECIASAELVTPTEVMDQAESPADTHDGDVPLKKTIEQRVQEQLVAQGIFDTEKERVVFKMVGQESAASNGYAISGSENIWGGFTELDDVVGVLAVLLIFSTPIIIVLIVSYAGYRKRKLFHDNLNMLIEQGRDLPPELFDYFESGGRPNKSFHTGVISCAVGLGIFFCFNYVGNDQLAAIGLIPLVMGVAYLLIWKLDSREGKCESKKPPFSL